MVKITVCSMMQDESRNIDFWYKNASRFADEILIGSVGERPSEKYGDIKYFDYHKDTVAAKGFYYVKNELIRHSTGDWIVMLDADEIMATDRDILEKAIDNESAFGFLTHTHDPVGEISDSIEDLALRDTVFSGESHARIFRKIPGMHCIGVIHEEIYYNGLPLRLQCGLLENIGMIHYGAKLHKSRRSTLYSELLLRQRDIHSLRCWAGDHWSRYVESYLDEARRLQREFWAQRGGEINPDMHANPWGTHWHVLERVINRFGCKKILELGTGYNSTRQLHSMGLEVHSYENNPEFAAEFPMAKLVSSYDEVPDLGYDLVFVDNSPLERRNVDINRFRNSIVVVHDTETAAYDYRLSVGTMKYCYTDMTYRPWTSVCSDKIDVNSVDLGAGFKTYVPVDWRW